MSNYLGKISVSKGFIILETEAGSYSGAKTFLIITFYHNLVLELLILYPGDNHFIFCLILNKKPSSVRDLADLGVKVGLCMNIYCSVV